MPVSAAQLQAVVSTPGADEAVSILNEISAVIDGLISKFADMPSLNIGESFAGAADAIAGIGGVSEEVASGLADAVVEVADFVESVAEISGVTEEASSGVSSFRASLDQIGSSLQQLGSNIGGVISGRISTFVNTLSEAASGPINTFVDGVQQIASTVSDYAVNAFNTFTDNIAIFGGMVSDVVSGPLNTFIDGVNGVASTISGVASDALNTFTSGMQSVASTVSDAVSGPLNSFIGGIQQVGSTISDAVSGPLGAFTDRVQQIGSTISDAVSGPLNSFRNSIQGFMSDISEAASGPLASLIEGIQNLSSSVSEAASGPMSSFQSGVQNAISGLGSMFQQVMSGSSGIDGLQNAFSGAVSGVQDFIGGIGDAASGVMDFAGSIMQGAMQLQMFAMQAQQLATALLGPAESAEQMQTAFTTLMGSTQAANDEMQKLDAFASKTPFKTMDIDQAASQLLGFGTNAKDVIPDLTSIGDALSAVGKGSAANLDQIVNIFGKIQTSGKLTSADMTQLSADGINAWSVLEQQTGKTQSQLQSMISAGLLPAGTAIKDLTTGIEANPLYAGGMAKQSQTMAGLLSTLKSNWDQMLASFGSPILKALEPVVTNIGNALSSQGFKDFGGSVGKNVADAFKSIGDFVTKNDIGGKIEALAQNLSGFFNNPNMKQFAQVVGQDLVTGFTKFMNAVSSPAFGSFMKSVGTFVGGALLLLWNGIKGIGEAVINTTKFFKDHQTAMDALIAVFSAIGIIILATLVPAFIAWAIAMGGVVIEALILAAPFILVGLIIAAVIFGIILAIQHWGDIVKWLTGIWGAVAGFFEWLWGQISGFFVGVGKWFADRFTEAYNGVIGAFGAAGKWFQDLWQGIVNDFNSILGGLGNLASNIWNGVTGAVKAGFNFVIDLINNVIKTIDGIKVAGFGVNIPLIPHLALGGLVTSGGMALVGEQGPELVQLPAGAQVIPNNQLNSSSASGGQVIHIHNYIDGKEITSNTMNRVIRSTRTSGPIRSNLA